MHNAVVHHPLTDTQPVHKQQSPASFPLSLYAEHGVIPYGIYSVRVSCPETL